MAIGWLESYLRKKKMLKPTILGKTSSAAQVIIFGYILLSTNFDIPTLSEFWYFLVSFLSIASLVQYIFIRFRDDKVMS